MSAAAPSAFDAVADRYDADEGANRVLVHMRARSLALAAESFPRGAMLLELGSGTGTEAAWLSRERRCRLALVDVSPRLLERAAAKVRATGPSALLGAHLLRAAHAGRLIDAYGRSSFDGAYSSLGPLNCEPTLEPVARALADLVRSRGSVVLSIMNRWCPTEVAWFAAHGRWRDAARRWRGPVQASVEPGGPRNVTTWYYSVREVARAFSAHFRVEHVEALPLMWPPPYLDFLVDRFDRLFRAIEPVERWAARRPLLSTLGDHSLVRLRRR